MPGGGSVDAALKLAETLGGETKTLIGNDMSAEILRFARFENVTQIVDRPRRVAASSASCCAARCRTISCAAPRASPSTS